MEIKLTKKPKNPIIIEGFPGFGLVGTIATEFLLSHLKCEKIGRIVEEKMPAIVAVHENKVVEPIGIFYNKQYNIVVIHAINTAAGFEWKMANAVRDLAKDLNAREVICIEGVGSNQPTEESRAFYYTIKNDAEKKFKKAGVSPLEEGIIVGVTGAVMLNLEKTPLSCIFAEAHTQLPDSKAAAKIIEVLDKYLGLKVDYKPLLKQAEQFEDKLKGMLSKGKEALDMQDKKQMSYVG